MRAHDISAADPETQAGYRLLLRERAFRPHLYGEGTSSVGDAMSEVAHDVFDELEGVITF